MITLYPIGTQYMSGGKNGRLCTLVDVWTTRNSAGDVVKVRYVATHPFVGGPVLDYDVNAVEIARGIERLREQG